LRAELLSRLSRVEELQQQVAEIATWQCFHCGFKTSDKAEAEAHFGDGDGESAICKYWTELNAEERLGEFQSLVQELNGERDEGIKLLQRAEAAEAEAEKAKGERDYKEQEYEKLRAMFFKMVDAKERQLGVMREALQNIRDTAQRGIDQDEASRGISRTLLDKKWVRDTARAALTPEPAQSTPARETEEENR